MSLCRDCPHSTHLCTLDKCDKIADSADRDKTDNIGPQLQAAIKAMDEVLCVCRGVNHKDDVGQIKDDVGQIADCIVEIITGINAQR